MRRTRRASRRYRGSRGGIGIVIPLLIVLCIIAAGVLYFVNENMAFTKDGTLFEAWGAKKEPEIVDANLVIEEDAGEEDKTAEDGAEEIETEASEETEAPVAPPADAVRARFLPIGTVKSTELFNAALAEIPADEKINTLVLEVKAEDGTLAFGSEHEFVADKQIVGDDSVLSQVIEKAKSAGYRVSLFMSCFKDNGAARNNFKHSVLANGGGVWRDEFETRWLSPYSEEARLYLTDIIKKLAALGPNEIILSNISFPVAGRTDMIDYGEGVGSKSEALSGFISEAQSAAGNVAVSAVYENYNEAYSSLGGQKPELFQDFARIYIYAKDSQALRSFEEGKALFGNMNVSIIPVGKAAVDEQFVIK